MLTPEQINAYHRDGYLIVRALFDAEEIDLLQRTAVADRQLDQQSFGRADGEEIGNPHEVQARPGEIRHRQLVAQHQAQQAFDHCKGLVKSAGLSGPGQVRVNKAGCLDRCAGGPVAVVYPEAVWYSYVDKQDIEEIVESHLKQGQVVERLLTPAHLGR